MTADLRAGIEALRSDLGEWSDELAGDVAYPTPAEQSASATLENVIAQLDTLLAAHPVQDEGAARAYFGEGYEFALTHLDDEPVQADLARLRPDRPVTAPGSRGNRPWSDWRGVQVSQGRDGQNDAAGRLT